MVDIPWHIPIGWFFSVKGMCWGLLWMLLDVLTVIAYLSPNTSPLGEKSFNAGMSISPGCRFQPQDLFATLIEYIVYRRCRKM